jgi:predicted dehydrogenase
VATEDRHFVRHVRHGEPWPITLAEARSALACAMAVEQSLAEGGPVAVSHEEGPAAP